MIVYALPASLWFLFGLYKFKRINVISPSHRSAPYNIMIVFTAIFLCAGYMTGSDWVNYELMYNDVSVETIYALKKEWLFFVLMLLFKSLGLGFFAFLISCKLFAFFIIARFFKRHSYNFYLVFAIFFTDIALLLFIDNPLRFMIAWAFIIFSYEYYIEKRYLYFTFYILFSSLFHISSLVMLVFLLVLPLQKLKKKHTNRFFLILFYLFLYTICNPPTVIKILDIFVPWLVPFFRGYYELAKVSDFSIITLGRVIYFIFYIFILIYRDDIISKYKDGYLVYYFSMAFSFFHVFGYALPTFFRLALFMAPFMEISMAIVLRTLKKKHIVRAFIVFYFLFSMTKNIYATYVYLPYTNYFISGLLYDYPYLYRKYFNRQKFFERTGEYPDVINK